MEVQTSQPIHHSWKAKRTTSACASCGAEQPLVPTQSCQFEGLLWKPPRHFSAGTVKIHREETILVHFFLQRRTVLLNHGRRPQTQAISLVWATKNCMIFNKKTQTYRVTLICFLPWVLGSFSQATSLWDLFFFSKYSPHHEKQTWHMTIITLKEQEILFCVRMAQGQKVTPSKYLSRYWKPNNQEPEWEHLHSVLRRRKLINLPKSLFPDKAILLPTKLIQEWILTVSRDTLTRDPLSPCYLLSVKKKKSVPTMAAVTSVLCSKMTKQMPCSRFSATITSVEICKLNNPLQFSYFDDNDLAVHRCQFLKKHVARYLLIAG